MVFSATAAAGQLEDSGAIVDTVEDLDVSRKSKVVDRGRVLAVELDATSPGRVNRMWKKEILGKTSREDVGAG